MKNKILTMILALASLNVYAETINFSGTVSTSCTFSNQTAGTLAATTNGYNYFLDAGFNSGIPANIDIAYTGAPTFGISAVSTLSSAPNGAPAISSFETGVSFGNSANNTSASNVGANNFTSGSKSFQLTNAVSSDSVFIKMKAVASAPFPVGQYDANTTITCQ